MSKKPRAAAGSPPDILRYHLLRCRLSRPALHRILSIVGLFRGDISFGDFLRFLLPGRFKSPETHWKNFEFFRDYVQRTVRPFVDSDGSVRLYGEKMRPFKGNHRELVGHFLEVITNDQYHMKQFIHAGDAVIDVGANAGVFSIAAAHRGATVYAFEPSGRTFEFLRENTAPYPNVHVFKLGLGDEAAEKEMTGYESISEAHRLSDAGLNGVLTEKIDRIVTERVSVTTLDAFAKTNALKKIDFIKIDAEGYEARILKGAAESIRKWKPVIAMSAYHRPNDKADLPKTLKAIYPGYVCKLYKDCEDDFICYVPGRGA